jgi:hypothetical protein
MLHRGEAKGLVPIAKQEPAAKRMDAGRTQEGRGKKKSGGTLPDIHSPLTIMSY